jgi:hypothetical protein
MPTDTEQRLCDDCASVQPAKHFVEYTLGRARAIVEHGLCICPPKAGGMGYLAPDTREIYLELQRELENTDPSIAVEEIGKAVEAATEAPEPETSHSTTIDGIVVETGPFQVISASEAPNGAYSVGPDGTDPNGFPALGAGMPEELWQHRPVPARPPDVPPQEETRRLPRVQPRGVEPEHPLGERRQPARKPRRKRKR